jgi:hypothetical protein
MFAVLACTKLKSEMLSKSEPPETCQMLCSWLNPFQKGCMTSFAIRSTVARTLFGDRTKGRQPNNCPTKSQWRIKCLAGQS